MSATDIDLAFLSGQDYLPLVIDHGSFMTKAGFAGEDMPRALIPSVVSQMNVEELEMEQEKEAPILQKVNSTARLNRRNRSDQHSASRRNMVFEDQRMPDRNISSARSTENDANHDSITLVGDEALGVDRSNSSVSFSANSYSFNTSALKNVNKRRDVKPFSQLQFPIQNGGIADDSWNSMEKIWESIFSHPKINCPPESQPILFSETCDNPKSNRVKIAETMFEKYKVPALYFAFKPVLSLYAQGKTTGLVLQMGHGATQVVPVYEGFPLDHAIVKMNLGGYDLTEFLKLKLTERLKKESQRSMSIDFYSIGGHKVATQIKETLCQLSLNYVQDRNTPLEKEYILPDRQVIRIGSEVYDVPEALFSPSLLGKTDTPGIHEAVIHVYEKCDGYVKQLLGQNILLAGGCSNFPNIKARLGQELNHSHHHKRLSDYEDVQLRVKDPRERVMSSWTGGSIIASLPMFQQLWVSKGDYDEIGKQALFSKCY